jgi:uncharacterized phage-like protein YoqJ
VILCATGHRPDKLGGYDPAVFAALVEMAHTHLALCVRASAAAKMQVRNEWMVDSSDGVVALWNGTAGGTANCVRYAEKVGRPIDNLWPTWERFYA